MIHVIAVLTAKPGKRDEVLKEFRANVPNVRAEKGGIVKDLLADRRVHVLMPS
jgi:quinol monooxygenase YgiN